MTLLYFHPVLDTSFDLILDVTTYNRHSRERLAMHQSRAVTRETVKKVVDQMLCLGEHDTAVRLLLESATDTDSPSYLEVSLLYKQMVSYVSFLLHLVFLFCSNFSCLLGCVSLE